ncbi:MarR family winged helix-turn-helix transcriptional regulator [Nocardioides sp. SR21]|uniref:MarR family winged helix-turn-helix transcriptional regulator n=1 Tax=Nocardioides sp. SR21 TaxID=2919501 RepID=UPI001FAA69A8|nr:MarR family transcriptional regulator [Nocardioides sp. SR21]
MADEHSTALDTLLRLSELMSADLARFERESGLSGSRIRLLWTLGITGPTTQQALAEALDVTPRNVTGLVDGLSASGHVTRQPHPTDRRATRVTLTDAGAETVRDLQRDHEDLARQLFGGVPPRRLAAFVATLEETVAIFERLMEEQA